MNKKGFTLIELLAVIVILAIIALIATPIVLNIINEASKSSAKESATAYIKAVEQGYVSKLTKDEKMESKEYTIGELDELGIKVKGDKPTGEKDTVTLQNGKVTDYLLTIKGYNIYCKDGNMIVESGKKVNSDLLDYTVTFFVEGKPYQILSVLKGQTINQPNEIPTSKNGEFSGWKINGVLTTFPYEPKENINIEAVFSSPQEQMEFSSAGVELFEVSDTLSTKLNNGIMIATYATKDGKPYVFTVSEESAAACAFTNSYYYGKGTYEYNGKTYYYDQSMTGSGFKIISEKIYVQSGDFSSVDEIIKNLIDYYNQVS